MIHLVRLLPYSTQRLRDSFSRLGLRRHPLACWFNSCDKLTQWDINSAILVSIEHTDKKEGSGSLKLVNDNVAAENLFFRPTPFSKCADFFGFWIKVINPPSDFDMLIRKYKTATGHSEGFRLYVSDSTLYYRPHAYGGYSVWGTATEITPNSWYWFEIRDLYPRHHYYINGSFIWDLTMGACDIVDYDKVEGYQASGKTLGTILLDLWRLAGIEQYPPT